MTAAWRTFHLAAIFEESTGGYVYLAMWDLMNDYVLRSSAIGLISYPTTDGIYLVDNGVWMGEISGFIFGVYDSQDEEASFMDTRMQLQQSG